MINLEITKDKGFERIIKIINGWRFVHKGVHVMCFGELKLSHIKTFDKSWHHGVYVDFKYSCKRKL